MEIVGGDRGGRQGPQHARVQRLDQDGPHDACDLGLVLVGHGLGGIASIDGVSGCLSGGRHAEPRDKEVGHGEGPIGAACDVRPVAVPAKLHGQLEGFEAGGVRHAARSWGCASLAGRSLGDRTRRSAGLTLPFVSRSIATAVSRDGIDLPRLIREACDRLHISACANQRSSRVSPIHLSSFVMREMCTTCT